jgi:hypothetical protein
VKTICESVPLRYQARINRQQGRAHMFNIAYTLRPGGCGMAALTAFGSRAHRA